MGPSAFTELSRQALLLMILFSLPPLGASLAVGFVTSLFQAATQIQESTLSVVPKLFAAVGALIVAAPWISEQLVRFTAQLLVALPEISR